MPRKCSLGSPKTPTPSAGALASRDRSGVETQQPRSFLDSRPDRLWACVSAKPAAAHSAFARFCGGAGGFAVRTDARAWCRTAARGGGKLLLKPEFLRFSVHWRFVGVAPTWARRHGTDTRGTMIESLRKMPDDPAGSCRSQPARGETATCKGRPYHCTVARLGEWAVQMAKIDFKGADFATVDGLNVALDVEREKYAKVPIKRDMPDYEVPGVGLCGGRLLSLGGVAQAPGAFARGKPREDPHAVRALHAPAESRQGPASGVLPRLQGRIRSRTAGASRSPCWGTS